MKKMLTSLAFIFALASCSNTPELETGEMKTLQLLKNAIEESNSEKIFADSRHLLSRKQVDAASIPILFVELKSGQNGTLTPYPGKGLGQTWLGADGATITLENGVLKASRGMGNDLMGSTSSIPPWSHISLHEKKYTRKLSYLSGNNKEIIHKLECKIRKDTQETIEIWDVSFQVTKYTETCAHNGATLLNTYYVDDKALVRKSFQYHSDTLGFITLERLDR